MKNKVTLTCSLSKVTPSLFAAPKVLILSFPCYTPFRGEKLSLNLGNSSIPPSRSFSGKGRSGDKIIIPLSLSKREKKKESFSSGTTTACLTQLVTLTQQSCVRSCASVRVRGKKNLGSNQGIPKRYGRGNRETSTCQLNYKVGLSLPVEKKRVADQQLSIPMSERGLLGRRESEFHQNCDFVRNVNYWVSILLTSGSHLAHKYSLPPPRVKLFPEKEVIDRVTYPFYGHMVPLFFGRREKIPLIQPGSILKKTTKALYLVAKVLSKGGHLFIMDCRGDFSSFLEMVIGKRSEEKRQLTLHSAGNPEEVRGKGILFPAGVFSHLKKRKIRSLTGSGRERGLVSRQAKVACLPKRCKKFSSHQKAGDRKLLISLHPLSCSGSRWVGGTLTNWGKISKMVSKYGTFSSQYHKSILKDRLYLPRYEKMKAAYPGLLKGEKYSPPVLLTDQGNLPKKRGQQSRQLYCVTDGKKISNYRERNKAAWRWLPESSTFRTKGGKGNLSWIEKEKESKKRKVSLSKTHRNLLLPFKKKPDLVFFVNPRENIEPIQEAIALKIPIIALVDSRTNSSFITYPIPVNNYSLYWIYFCLNFLVRFATCVEFYGKNGKKGGV